MSKTEDAILGRLQQTPSEVVTRKELIQVSGTGGNVPDALLDVMICRLRRKFGKDAIKTHRCLGYSWQAQG